MVHAGGFFVLMDQNGTERVEILFVTRKVRDRAKCTTLEVLSSLVVLNGGRLSNPAWWYLALSASNYIITAVDFQSSRP